MRLLIFNPDHDMALAANYPAYIAKTAGQLLMRDMAWLPAVYGQQGDAVLLLDSQSQVSIDAERIAEKRGLQFVSAADVHSLVDVIDAICPWGWNRQIVYKLQKLCPSLSHLLPSDNFLQTIRRMSSRRYAAEYILQPLVSASNGLFVGEAVACFQMQEVFDAMRRWQKVVVKEPWSGSGRGLRYIDIAHFDAYGQHWCERVIERQGCIMVEPHYHRLVDLAAEFHIDGCGVAYFDGTSLFFTHNGQYQGNIIADDNYKRLFIERFLPYSVFSEAVSRLLSVIPAAYRGYEGSLGVDMMIVGGGEGAPFCGNRLHPCVEVNLRQTMGHVALYIPFSASEPQLLSISHDTHYHLSLKPLVDTDLYAVGYW